MADDSYQIQFLHNGESPELVKHFMVTLLIMRLSRAVAGLAHVAGPSWDEWPVSDGL